MKQLVVIILFFQVLIGGVLPIHDKDETKGIPNLIQHYYAHLRESKGELSIIEFLSLHYKAGSQHHENEHEKLPPFHWHEIHYITAFQFAALQVQPPRISILTVSPHFTWENFYSYISQNTSLDPPKVLLVA